MLATDTHFEIRVRLAPILDCHAHQLPDTVTVEGLERVDGENFDWLFSSWLFQPANIFQQELAFGIVTADTKGGLGQVISTEAEELGDGCDLSGGQSSTG